MCYVGKAIYKTTVYTAGPHETQSTQVYGLQIWTEIKNRQG